MSHQGHSLPCQESTALGDSPRVAGVWPTAAETDGGGRLRELGRGALVSPVTAQASLTLCGARQGGITGSDV